jgi:hypothetical protein
MGVRFLSSFMRNPSTATSQGFRFILIFIGVHVEGVELDADLSFTDFMKRQTSLMLICLP